MEKTFIELYDSGAYQQGNLFELTWEELIRLFTIADENAEKGTVGYKADFAAHYQIEDEIWRRASKFKPYEK